MRRIASCSSDEYNHGGDQRDVVGKRIVDFRNLLAVGLDVGTGGVRTVAMDLSGAWRRSAVLRYPPETKHSEGVVAEQDPRAWTTAARAALGA